jgi:hypothetical protein
MSGRCGGDAVGPESLLQREKDRKRGRNGPLHLAPFPFYPSFSLSRGETWGRPVCFMRKEGAPLSRDGRASSPLPGEGLSRTPIREQTGWVDGQRCRRLVLATISPSPQDDLPSVGLFSPLSRGETWEAIGVLCKKRRRSPEPRRLGLKSPPWRGRGRVGRWATVSTVGAGYYLPLFFSPLQGRDLGAGGVLCKKRRRSPEPRRSGLSPLPGEGGAGWVDGQ